MTPLDGPDVRLSTAALISARFPLISPAGTIRMKASAKDDGLTFGDHVVDGGYFENSGLTTALDIIAELPKDLKPILVSISNDPEADKLIAGLPRRPAETPLVQKADDGPGFRVFGLIEGPLSALSATRDGHADEAEGMAETALAGAFFRLTVAQTPDLNPTKPILPYDQGVCSGVWKEVAEHGPLEMTKVSMSWWLSASVQADLDAQRCDTDNRATIAAILKDSGGDKTQ